jgi:hypothetical protein
MLVRIQPWEPIKNTWTYAQICKMKIDEIVMVHVGGINLNNINRDNEQLFGFNHEIDSYPMYKNIQDGYWIYYLVNESNEIIAATALLPVKNFLQIKGVYVAPKYRRKHLALKIYHAIKHNEHRNLMSDINQTDSSRKLWNTLSKSFNVAVYDLTANSIVSTDINTAYNESDNLVLITETTFNQQSLLIPILKINI